MKKKDPWWKSAQVVITLCVGVLVISGTIVGNISQAAKQEAKIDVIETEVGEMREDVEENQDKIENTERQYMLIQQSLGVIQDNLRELKKGR